MPLSLSPAVCLSILIKCKLDWLVGNLWADTHTHTPRSVLETRSDFPEWMGRWRKRKKKTTIIFYANLRNDHFFGWFRKFVHSKEVYSLATSIAVNRMKKALRRDQLGKRDYGGWIYAMNSKNGLRSRPVQKRLSCVFIYCNLVLAAPGSANKDRKKKEKGKSKNREKEFFKRIPVQ